MRYILTIFLLLSNICLAQDSLEELRSEFMTRVKKAINSKSLDEFKALSYSAESATNKNDLWAFNAIISSTGTIEYTYADIPETKSFVHIRNGFRYSPSLTPIGYMKITYSNKKHGNETLTFAYGLKQNRIFFTTTVKEKLDWNGPPDDKQFLISISPASDSEEEKQYRIDYVYNASGVDINGVSYGRKTLFGQYIKSVKVTNLANKEALSLRIDEYRKNPVKYEKYRTITEIKGKDAVSPIIYERKMLEKD